MSRTDMMIDPQPEENILKGWHVLLILLGFFGLMFTVNGIFLYHAITSFPGEDVKKSYVQGLNYNQTLQQRAQQADLGWTAEAGLENGQIIFRLHDETGAALPGHVVIGEARRLATMQQDHALVFRARANGDYFADAANLSPGQWEVRIRVFDRDGDTVLFQATKMIALT